MIDKRDFEEYKDDIGNHGLIYDRLGIGEENAIHMSRVAKELDISERKIRERVQQERAAGCLICSSVKGYFRPKNRHEIRATRDKLKKTAIGILASIKPFNEALGYDSIDNEQLSLADYMDMNA